jgi:hypothetical protein
MESNRRRVHAAVLLCLGVALILVFFSPYQRSFPLLAGVNADAARTIDESLTRNLTVFLTLSTIKATLDIIEGSSFGVEFFASMQIEGGDIVQSAYDTVDFVWHLFISVLFLLTFYELILKSGITSLGVLLIGIGTLSLALAVALPSTPKGVSVVGEKAVKYGLLVCLFVPLVFILTESLSRHYLAPLRNEAVAELSALQSHMASVRERAMEGNIKGVLHQTGALIEESTRSLLEYLAILMLELIALPIGLIVGFRMLGAGIPWAPRYLPSRTLRELS